MGIRTRGLLNNENGQGEIAPSVGVRTGCLLNKESGRRDSNSRMVAWEATALPLGYARMKLGYYFTAIRWFCKTVGEKIPPHSRRINSIAFGENASLFQ